MRTFSKAAVLATAMLAAANMFMPLAFTQGNVRVISGSITSDTTWTANNIYVLSGAVFVEGAALTIEAGTRIIGESATNGTLIVARGAQIFSNGRADAPVVMTSDQPVGQRGRGDWGGLIINGAAVLNVPGGEAFGEGDTGVYGGTNDNDSSGRLRYTRVEFAGTEFSPDNELNGIAFQGVGRGTEVEFVQVHFNQDDGIEFFGGAVDVKYAVTTGIADDSYDWTDGWRGRGQFWIAQQYGDDADQGIEADNNAENNDLTPRSNPKLYNITLIGDPDRDLGDESDLGLLLREGTAAQIKNGIVMGFKEEGIEINGAASWGQAQAGAIVLQSMIFFQNNPNFSANADDDGAPTSTAAFMATQQDIAEGNPGLRDPYDTVSPDYRPGPDAMATSGAVAFALPPNDGFFDVARFIGAMGQAKEPDPEAPYLGNWVAGWTNFEPN